MSYQIIQDDILNWAGSYNGPKFHALLCDPPYHLTSITKRFGKPGSAPAKVGVYNRGSKGFMGQQWDGEGESGGIAFNPETWAALAQHLHPGGFILAFAGTRGYHRMACAMEDSGLIIHPAMVWTFLSGFPKATSIANQIDKAAGVKGEVVGRAKGAGSSKTNSLGVFNPEYDETAPATPLAQTWAGHRYGLQSLKPALEFIAVAQVPYSGKPVDCITRTGAGAFNIDGGRIPASGKDREKHLAEWNRQQSASQSHWLRLGEIDLSEYANDLGRWPANLLLDQAGAELLDRQSGERPAGSALNGNEPSQPSRHTYEGGWKREAFEPYNDSGGASRMFFTSDWQYEILEQLENADPLKYEPKVSTSEREAGLSQFRRDNKRWVKQDQNQSIQVGMGILPLKAIIESRSDVLKLTNGGWLWHTIGSGSNLMGQFRQGIKFIIRMRTNKITDSKTLNYLTQQPTSESIADVNSEMESGGSLAVSATSLSQSTKKTGTSQEKDGLNTVGVDNATLERWSSINVHVKKDKEQKPVNQHPCLKPISLTKYLATLILPPDAYAPRRLLCPFSGSGSEMAGAILAGWEEVTGIESNPDYHEISKARLAWWSQWPGWGQTEVDKILSSLESKSDENEQLNFFDV